VPGLNQLGDHGRADVTAGAGDENTHGNSWGFGVRTSRDTLM
jgi:hypothetical protein